MARTYSVSIVADAAVENIAQIRRGNDDEMAVTESARCVSALGTDAIAEESVHSNFVQANAVIEYGKDVVFVQSQSLFDGLDHSLRLARQGTAATVFLALDRGIESFPISLNAGDDGGFSMG